MNPLMSETKPLSTEVASSLPDTSTKLFKKLFINVAPFIDEVINTF
jgi:hypothetical protein